MTTKTDIPAVPAWALEAARGVRSLPERVSEEETVLDIAREIARHAAQAEGDVHVGCLAGARTTGQWHRETLAERDKLVAANAELVEALERMVRQQLSADYCGVCRGQRYAHLGDKEVGHTTTCPIPKAREVLARHAKPKEGV